LTYRVPHVTLRRSMKNKSAARKPADYNSKPKLVIKKYSDRRLYDAAASRYVKLDDIAQMVRDGIEVKVVDARSGQDLTHFILTQIILDHARAQSAPLPLQLLEQLVRASDAATHEFLSWYLTSTLDLYQKVQDTLRTRLPEAKSVVARPIDFMRKLLAEHSWPTPAPAPDVQRMEQLSRRVEELEARLGQHKEPTGHGKKARRPT
jgi:polyhydroxyalkanoate synthesis repressor PhaR